MGVERWRGRRSGDAGGAAGAGWDGFRCVTVS